ncbi:MAG: hypothetical protein Q9166_007072 [cf. Caloplaca sp. 2 TL-2023]
MTRLPVSSTNPFEQQSQSGPSQSTGQASQPAMQEDKSAAIVAEDEDTGGFLALSVEIPSGLQETWKKVSPATNVDQAGLEELVELFKKWLPRKTSAGDQPGEVLTKCANGPAANKEMCLTSFLRSKNVSDFTATDGSTACGQCKGSRSCFRVSWVSTEAQKNEELPKRWYIIKRAPRF